MIKTLAAAALWTFLSASARAATPAPTGLTASASGYRVNLNWNYASGVFWVVERRANGGSYSRLTQAYSNSYADSSVSNGSYYFYRIYAYSTSSGASPYSAEVYIYVSVSLPAPTGLTAIGGNRRITLSWNAVPTAQYYRVYRSVAGFDSYYDLANAYQTSYTDYSVAVGVSYDYKVRAVDSVGTLGLLAGPVRAADMTNAPLNNGYPESPHPYPNSMDRTWSYQGPPDAYALLVTFDSRCWSETGFDQLTLMDAAGNRVSGPEAASNFAGRTFRIEGDSFRVRFTSDYSITGWGFAFSAVTPLVPPPPPPPETSGPAPGSLLTGPVVLSWSPRSGALSYQVEWSSNGVTWTSARTPATSYTPALGNGAWQWRVRSVNSAGAGAAGAPQSYNAVSGYAMSSTLLSASPVRLRYRTSFTAYRSPAALPLSVTGLPAGVTWSFDPPATTGRDSESTLQLDGVSALIGAGPAAFTVMAGTTPVSSGVITVSATGAMAVSDAHAYPNPARAAPVHLRFTLTMPPQSLRLRVYDLAGGLVLEAAEQAPFASFRTLGPLDYEYLWGGGNASGHAAAADKYIFWLEATGGGATGRARGVFTYLRR